MPVSFSKIFPINFQDNLLIWITQIYETLRRGVYLPIRVREESSGILAWFLLEAEIL